MKAKGIGILGLGSYLPADIRKNDYWSLEAFEAFQKGGNVDLDLGSAPARDARSPQDLGERPHCARGDGEVEGRSLSRSSREASGRREDALLRHGGGSSPGDALKNAGLEAGDIDLMLLHELVSARPEPSPGNAGLVHSRLGLRPSATAIEVDGVCGSFPFQAAAGGGLYLGRSREARPDRCSRHCQVPHRRLPQSAVHHLRGRGHTRRSSAGSRPIAEFCPAVSTTDGAYAGVAVLAAQNGAAWYDARGVSRLVPHSTAIH